MGRHLLADSSQFNSGWSRRHATISVVNFTVMCSVIEEILISRVSNELEKNAIQKMTKYTKLAATYRKRGMERCIKFHPTFNAVA